MSHRLECDISDSLWDALQRETERSGDSLSHVVQHGLSEALGLEHHSLFQVSTSGAIVKGVFKGSTTVRDLTRHGDFGLGTFEDLDGELIMLDGRCYRAVAGGIIEPADDSQRVPFATVTRFSADQTMDIDGIESFEALQLQLDERRPSHNVFIGMRIEGLFETIEMRAACKAQPGEGLVDATSHQSEFEFARIDGTLVGVWTPEYAKAIGVPGYHFHFISTDRTRGGHVLDVKAAQLSAALHLETDIHIGIPETTAFLTADLQDDPSEDLNIAEKSHTANR